MKRSDMMVGIDGTAQGRMNSTDSHLIQVRAWMKKPDSSSATIILTLIATIRNTSVLTTERAKIGSSNRCDVGLRAARDPEPVADRIENEENEDQDVGDDQDDAPGLPRRHPCGNRRAAASGLGSARSWTCRHSPGRRPRPPDRRPGSQFVVSRRPA